MTFKEQPKKKPLTHIDIARLAKVNQSTVSRALDPEQRHLISAEVVERILSISNQHGFKANILAQRLRRKKSNVIALMLPPDIFTPPQNLDFEVSNHLLPWQEVKGIMHEALARNYDVQLLPSLDETVLSAEKLMDHLGFPHSDGVILSGLSTGARTQGKLRAEQIPHLTTGVRADEAVFPLVACDQAPGITAALLHLAGKGHQRVAFLSFARDFATVRWGAERYQAFKAGLATLGMDSTDVEFSAVSIPELRALVGTWIRRLPFTAVFCINDMIAYRLIQELTMAGLRVPEDVAVVGFDNNPLFQAGPRALSTVDLPLYDLGRRALGRLTDFIRNGETPAASELLPSVFIERKTT